MTSWSAPLTSLRQGRAADALVLLAAGREEVAPTLIGELDRLLLSG